eukprot:6184005-Pleurochrysis_carterae.AAC.2
MLSTTTASEHCDWSFYHQRAPEPLPLRHSNMCTSYELCRRSEASYCSNLLAIQSLTLKVQS